jgi:hypothetical protein
MVNWFKSKYEKVEGYSPNWYGIMDYAPNSTILLYDDNICECIGYMNEELPDDEHLTSLTEEQATEIIDNYEDVDGVWFGEKLEKRWDTDELIEGVEE